ncbi:SpoIIE family protein phosphatase [Albimonas pacifica]|uniref:Sigma-B regulation protein RsbU (Phosphoserine phosphatase) n=1 Tax=Albimonas pacifica TaxID=1114924 RepID=A0A1I3C0U1_9RHOB|nr:SpoIIE family protein phosphatase [Albimonas pacifica]SFH68185.1 sigma-B regulation protein RsbU (phosphoserine phosphatase) [Albimonas pacifica]
MLLSTRIAIIVSLAFVFAFGSLLAIGLQREALAVRPHTDVAIAGEAALWRKIVELETLRLAELREEIAAEPAVVEAAGAGDLSRLRRLGAVLLQSRLMAEEVSDVQLLDAQGRVIYASAASAEPPPLLDVATVGAVLDGPSIGGVRQVAPGAFRVVSAARFGAWAGAPTVIAVGVNAARPLEAFAEAMQSEAYLLSTRGRLVEGTAPRLWRELAIELPQRVGVVRQAPLDERLFSVTAIPIADISAGSAGLLVAVQDATPSLKALQRLTAATMAVMIAVALATVGGLWLYLRVSFAPLQRAVGTLGALARGDMSARLPPGGDDEIGQIASAVARLRRSLRALDDARRQRELQRRRQERFVRRQMEALAETLEPGAREEVLADLRRIVAATRGAGEAGSDAPAPAAAEAPAAEAAPGDTVARLIREDDQLGPIAAVLQQMSGRVVDQHRRLSELVARLREALVRETRLASLQQELAIARELQHSVLPADMADRPGYAVKGVMESAQEVGGDFYDFFERPDGRLVFVIADVSGKGVPAAFFMAISRTLLKAIALFEPDPAQCIRQLNDLLAVDNDRMMFVTLLFGIFDPAAGRAEIVNAGHLPPVRLGREGAALVPSTGDMAVAVAEGLEFTTLAIDLEPGESLVLYTDGVTEAFDAAGDQFGEQRMVDRLAPLGGAGPETVAAAMLETVKAFEQGVEQSDDITLLIVRRAG